MFDWKKQRVVHVADDEGRLVPEAAGTPEPLAVTPLEQFDHIVVENGSPGEATLRAGEILESIGDAFYFLDEELRFTYVNRKAEQLWGKRREDLLGRKFMDVCPHVEGSHSNLKIMQALEEGRPLTYETLSPIIGSWVEVSAYPSSSGLSVYYRDITERKRAEVAVRQRDDLLRVIFDSLSSHVAVLDRAGVITYVSRSWEEFAGQNQGQQERIGVGVNYLDVCRAAQTDDPAVREAVEGIEAVIAGERPTFSIEYPCHAPAEQRWFLMQVDPMPPDQGGVVISHVNITERRRADEALRESEKRFRVTFEQAAVGVAHSSLHGRLLLMNQKLCDILGYTPEEILTKSYQEVTHPEDLVDELEYARRLLSGEIKTASYEKRYIRKDGSPVWVNLTASLVRNEETGEPSYFVAILQDISARKVAEEALRESEEFNRRIVESSSDCIKILDPEGRLLYISPRGQELLGIEDPGPYINGSWVELWPGEGRQSAWAAIERARAEGVGGFQAFGPTPQGQAKWWDTVLTPMSDARGRVTRLLAISRDITKSKQAEESLKSALEEVRLLKDRLQEENVYLREEAKVERHFGEIVGRSNMVRPVLRKIEQVAVTDATVLITGETGTGKELVARAIHRESPRRDRALVKVNCAALPPNLIESELFGHEKGSFTGAVGRKIGRFELADGGTLFLDEIGELPIEVQPKLLRVLQDGEFERLGSAQSIRADVRVIAATNRDLSQEVQARRFRADLFYRLNVYPIIVPPLRQRQEDIPLLVEHFVRVLSKKMGKEITSVAPSALEALRSYHWPGNVRELANVIERAVITTTGTVLQISNTSETLPVPSPHKPSKTLAEVEREYIAAVSEATGWEIEGPDGAAKILGLPPSTLRTRMQKLGIQIVRPGPRHRRGEEATYR
jgi:PAS domain S-box-containing protein